MKTIIGILLILIGIALGLWLGLWVMFLGGIIQIINSIKATPVDAFGIALGIVRFFFSGLVGWLSWALVTAFGVTLLDNQK